MEITVDYCRICHSDLSMLDNEWGLAAYQFVPGREVAGRIAQIGKNAAALAGGLGGQSGLLPFPCPSCHSGDHNLCATAQSTIDGRHGGFADIVRAEACSVVKLPEEPRYCNLHLNL